MRQQLQFLKHFLRNPTKVGAITALNDNVSNELIKHIRRSKINHPIKILEVGAGYGNISKFILNNIRKEDQLDIVEVDSNCCDHLEKLFQNEENVIVHCKSILNWNPNYKYDFIISTLPFNSYPIEFVESVINSYQNLLDVEGILSYVEYSGLLKIRKTFAQGEKKSLMTTRKQFLDDLKSKYLIGKKRVVNNFPPCNVYHLKIS